MGEKGATVLNTSDQLQSGNSDYQQYMETVQRHCECLSVIKEKDHDLRSEV